MLYPSDAPETPSFISLIPPYCSLVCHTRLLNRTQMKSSLKKNKKKGHDMMPPPLETLAENEVERYELDFLRMQERRADIPSSMPPAFVYKRILP